MRVGETQVLGRTISFVAGGEGSRDVLFLHGFGADRSTWMFTLPAVAAGARVVALDLPGHGRSSPDVGAGDVPFLAEMVLGFMDGTGLVRPHVVAHSLGAAIALEIAVRAPERVAALSLFAPAGFGESINRDFIDAFPGLSDAGKAAATLSLLVARPAMINSRMIDDVLVYLARPGVRAALSKIAEAVFPDGRQRYRYDKRIASLGIPVEMFWGREDRILSPWREAPATVPVHVLPDAGHLAHMELAQRVNRLLVAALHGSPGGD